MAMTVLDTAIANVALPTIAHDFGAAPSESIWIVNAYQLAIVTTLLPLASLGEIVGYRRIYRIGLGLFTVASLVCAFSHSLQMLTIARTLQGLGAAGVMSVNGALVRFIYPQARLGQGIGFNAMVVSASSAIGPTVAAGILALGPWQWLFGVNIPIGLAALAVGWRALPQNPLSERRFDWASALLNAFTFGLVISGVDVLTRTRAKLAGALETAAGLAVGALLVLRELRMPRPLVPLDLLRNPIFALSIATSIASFSAQMLAFVALPFHFENTLHFSQVETGLLLTPWPVAVALMAPVAGWLADRMSTADPLRRRAGGVLRWTIRAGAGAVRGRRVRHRLAHGAVRRRLRPLPVAQQPHDADLGAARAGRGGGRHAGHRAADRPDHRRGADRDLPALDGRAGRGARPLGRRRLRRRRGRGQPVADGGAGALQAASLTGWQGSPRPRRRRRQGG